MSKIKVKISRLTYNGQFYFKVNTTSAIRIKAVSSRKFSRTLRCWHLPNTLNIILDELRLYFEVRVRTIDLCAVFDRLKKATVGSYVTIRRLRQCFAIYLPISNTFRAVSKISA